MPAARDESRKGFSRVFFFFQAKITINHCVRKIHLHTSQCESTKPGQFMYFHQNFRSKLQHNEIPSIFGKFSMSKNRSTALRGGKNNRRKKTEGSYLETITSLQSQICNIFSLLFLFMSNSQIQKKTHMKLILTAAMWFRSKSISNYLKILYTPYQILSG